MLFHKMPKKQTVYTGRQALQKILTVTRTFQMLVFLTLKMTTVSFQFMILLLKLKIMYLKKSQIVKMTNYSLQKSTLMRPRQLMGVLSLRNNFLKYEIKFENNFVRSWKHIVQFYELDRASPIA